MKGQSFLGIPNILENSQTTAHESRRKKSNKRKKTFRANHNFLEIFLISIQSAIVKLMGETNLGFKSEELGLHLIRSGEAMAMFLSGISTTIIQARVGHWSSEAFLEYIREQVENFTWGILQRMIQHEHVHTINATASAAQDNKGNSIFIPSQQGNGDPVDIQHAIHFSKVSMN